MGPIPWTVIFDYASAHGLDPSDREDFSYFIRQMDDAYLEYNSQKVAEATPPPASGKK